MAIGVYAGSFDPFTIGHLSIIKTASNIFEKVYVVIAINKEKNRHYPVKEMKSAIIDTLKEEGIFNVEVFEHDALVADFCDEHGAEFLIRGLRNNIDYNYEENIANINKLVNPSLETVYFRGCSNAISSSMVRELHSFGKDVSIYVPDAVYKIIESI